MALSPTVLSLCGGCACRSASPSTSYETQAVVSGKIHAVSRSSESDKDAACFSSGDPPSIRELPEPEDGRNNFLPIFSRTDTF